MRRSRDTRDHVPTTVMVEYYAQRGSAGLILSEATGISLQGLGWPFATGIWNDEQIVAWRRVTDSIHAAGGRIFCQLWHMGGVVHSNFMGGEKPVSASVIAAPGLAHAYEGKLPHVVPRSLRAEEIPKLIDDYRRAAGNALRAGFDSSTRGGGPVFWI